MFDRQTSLSQHRAREEVWCSRDEDLRVCHPVGPRVRPSVRWRRSEQIPVIECGPRYWTLTPNDRHSRWAKATASRGLTRHFHGRTPPGLASRHDTVVRLSAGSRSDAEQIAATSSCHSESGKPVVAYKPHPPQGSFGSLPPPDRIAPYGCGILHRPATASSFGCYQETLPGSWLRTVMRR